MSRLCLARAGLAIALASLAGSCGDTCANRIVARVAAPGGRRDAVLFERDCGAATDFSTQVAILAPGRDPENRGNIFIADANHDSVRRGAWGGPWAEIHWLSPDHLMVRYAAGVRVYQQERAIEGVAISYEAVPR